MDAASTIASLANAEGRRIRPVRDEAEMLEYAESGRSLPYIRIGKKGGGAAAAGRLVASGHDATGHDNEGRMPYIVSWLNERVLPMADPDVDLTGNYRIELHDSYTYLQNRRPHDNALVFGRPQQGAATHNVALAPDTFQMGDYGGLVERARCDPVKWADKKPLLFFAGSTTGDRDPLRNERIRACVWSLRHRDVARFYITNIVQMDPGLALQALPTMAMSAHVPVDAHWEYKYQVNIQGNTACWSRVPMIMASSSLMLNLPQTDMQWFYPALADRTHFVGADDFDDLLKKREFCMANDGWCKHVVQNANRFVSDFLTADMAAAYMVQLLETAASWGAP